MPFEERFIRPIKHKQRPDIQVEQAEQAVVESSQGRVGAPAPGLDLEEPDGDVDREAQGGGGGGGGVVGGGEGGEGVAGA